MLFFFGLKHFSRNSNEKTEQTRIRMSRVPARGLKSDVPLNKTSFFPTKNFRANQKRAKQAFCEKKSLLKKSCIVQKSSQIALKN